MDDEGSVLLEIAWGIIANAGGGDWNKETPEWRGAAERWRDRYFDYLKTKNEEAREPHER